MYLIKSIIGILFISFFSSTYASEYKFSKCMSEASRFYGIPVIAACSIAHTENGRPGMAVQNKDGSYDLGVMQINDSQPWFKVLKKQGLTRKRLIENECENIWSGVYILANEIYQAKDFWKGMGNYHNRRSPYHEIYLKKVKENWVLINKGRLKCQ